MSKALERVQNALEADEQRHAVRLKVGAKALGCVGCVGCVGYTPNIVLKYGENADKALDLEVPYRYPISLSLDKTKYEFDVDLIANDTQSLAILL